MPSRFQTDTAVEPLGSNCFRARIDGGWWIVRGPNGGYLAAILVNAFKAVVDDPERRLRSLTIHYTRPPVEGPADIDVSIERAGRTLTTATARMLQGGKLMAIAIAALATDREGESFTDLVMPAIAPPDELPSLPPQPTDIPMRARYDTRWGIGTPPLEGAASSGSAEVGGWIRLAEGGPVDDALVAALTDAWLPAVFTRLAERNPVPTVDLTVHFRESAPERDEWCLVRFRTNVLTRGFLEEDGEIWSADGRLLAQSRQLGLLLPMS